MLRVSGTIYYKHLANTYYHLTRIFLIGFNNIICQYLIRSHDEFEKLFIKILKGSCKNLKPLLRILQIYILGSNL